MGSMGGGRDIKKRQKATLKSKKLDEISTVPNLNLAMVKCGAFSHQLDWALKNPELEEISLETQLESLITIVNRLGR